MGTGTPTTMWQLTMAALSVSMPHELSIQSKLSRRTHLLSSSMAALALLPCKQAMAVSARTGLSSVFTGEYEDPKHPGCLRSIKVEGAKMGPDGRRSRKPTATVKGVDGDACSEPPALSDVWKAVGEVNELPPSKGSGDDQPDPTIKVDVRATPHHTRSGLPTFFCTPFGCHDVYHASLPSLAHCFLSSLNLPLISPRLVS